MIASPVKNFFLLLVFAAAYSKQSAAQICINKYASLRYKGTTFDTFTHSIVTPHNEIVSTGRLYDYNTAGHIAKFSEKGTPIWSYQYTLDFYDFIKAIFFKAVNISDIANTRDGGFIIAGNVEQVLSPFGLPPPVKKWGLMAKIDKFGQVTWTKTLSNMGEFSFSNIYQTADGDYIAYLSADNGKKKGPGDHSYGRVMRVDPGGKIKWSTFLFTYLFDAGGLGVDNKRGITQGRNNNIIIADVVHETTPAGAIKEGNLHFLEVDYSTGKMIWETNYEYPAPANDTAYLPDIVNAMELPNGKFSFITTLYLPGAADRLIKKGVNIITSNKGIVEKVVAYIPGDGSTVRITGAAIDKNNGTRTLLINKGGKGILMNIDDEGRVNWQHGYNDGAGEFPANCFSAGKNGYNIFMSNNQSLQSRLVITDAAGAIDCVNETADIIVTPASLNYGRDSVVTNSEIQLDDYYDYAHPLKRGDEYPLIKNIDCQETLACCTDVVDSSIVHHLAICEGKDFMLPDSSVIKDSGTYYVTYKTVLGCDSIVFYQVSLDKEVSKLTVGNDTCLNGQQSLTITATEGFEKYYWMNSTQSSGAGFTITEPGKYFVGVENVCGSKTDSIEIFEECDYRVYMPTAFTPNADGINDYFRIPPSNKNHLNILSVYNRQGKLVFQTRNAAIGWDGTYKNEPMNADTYVWYLEMTGLSGNRVARKGYVVLIR